MTEIVNQEVKQKLKCLNCGKRVLVFVSEVLALRRYDISLTGDAYVIHEEPTSVEIRGGTGKEYIECESCGSTFIAECIDGRVESIKWW